MTTAPTMLMRLFGTSGSEPQSKERRLFKKRVDVSGEIDLAVKEIPYLIPTDDRTLKTVNGHYVRVWRLEGIPYYTLDSEERDHLHLEMHRQLEAVTEQGIVYYTHLIRREVTLPDDEGLKENTFAFGLSRNYRASLAERRFFQNEMYLSVVYQPQTGENVKQKLDHISLSIETGFSRYHAAPLREYERGGHKFSALLSFLRYLMNGYEEPTPLVMQNLQEVMLTSMTRFPREKLDSGSIFTPERVIHIAALGIKTYPRRTGPGKLHVLLSLPFEFVLTQSFACLSKESARDTLNKAVSRLAQTEDDATSDAEDIAGGGEGTALNDLAAGKLFLGEHHLVFLIKAQNEGDLNRHVAMARKALADVECIAARESLALEAAFWSQLPGNLTYRPRPTTITSWNFVGMTSFYGEEQGTAKGNHWGPSLAVFRTVFGTPFDLNLHVKDVGHTFICGPTGWGKTTLQLFLAAMQDRHGATQVLFDYGRGSEAYVWAQRGRFFALPPGERTGMNPYQGEPTPGNILFVQKLFLRLVTMGNREVSQRQVTELEEVVEKVFRLDKKIRRPSSMLEYLNRTEPDGLAKKLARWVGDGAMAWVFDNPEDTIDFERRVTGFNIKHFLDDDDLRAPIMMYLFHRIEALSDGRRLAVNVGEFWRVLDDEFCADWVKRFLNTGRKNECMFVGETQSPNAVAESSIAHAVIEQTATKIYLGNPEATKEVYCGKFGLKEREFDLVKGMGRNRFLLKQPSGSILLQFDLGAPVLRDDLAVLSGSDETARQVESIRAEVGNDPEDWRPLWNAQRRLKVRGK